MLAACEAGEVFALLEGSGAGARDATAAFTALYTTERGPWLARALLAYHARTGSTRMLALLARAPEQHARHLLDALHEHMRADTPSVRHAALAALAPLVARRPTWLHRLPPHPLTQELVRAARSERDPLPLLHALLTLAALLPAAPALSAAFAPDLIDALLRPAALDPQPSQPARNHLHLAQLALFHAMYATTPCTLLDTLRVEYTRARDAARVAWERAVLPLFESVRLHPALVTESRLREADAARWAGLDLHDVVADCRRLSLPARDSHRTDTVPPGEDRGSTPRPRTSLAAPPAPASPAPGSGAYAARASAALWPGGDAWFALSDRCGADSAPQTPLPADVDSAEPPEAAVEATPENTPAKETRAQFRFPVDSTAVRALGRQPPSPMRKETSPSAGEGYGAGGGSIGGSRLTRVALDRAALEADGGAPRRRAPDSPVPFGGAPPPAGASVARPEPSRPLTALDDEDREVLELTERAVETAAWPEGEERGERGRYGNTLYHDPRALPHRLHGSAQSPDRPPRRPSSCPPSARAGAACSNSVATQTLDVWPAPYEFLVADFFRRLPDDAKQAIGEQSGSVDEWRELGGVELRLEGYLREVYEGRACAGALTKNEADDMLALAHAQLMYERWRREAHAERNRRLLGRCRAARALELQLAATRDRLRGTVRERDELRARLHAAESAAATGAVSERDAPLDAALVALEVERGARARAEAALREAESARAADAAELQRSRGQAWETARHVEALARGALASERRAEHVRRLRRELLVLAEREARLSSAARTAAARAPPPRSDRDHPDPRESAMRALRERVGAAQRETESATYRAETAAARVHELEAVLAVRDGQLTEMKRAARHYVEEGEARHAALRDKYDALLCVVRRGEAQRLRTLAGAPPPTRVDTSSPATDCSRASSQLESATDA